MRGLSVRRIASTALCTALLAGVTGPAAVAADSARERVPAASRAPVPGADALLVQIKVLANLGIVLTPVTDLLNAVLKADNGQLPAAQATSLVQAAKDAIAKVTAVAPASSTASSTLTAAAPGTKTPAPKKPAPKTLGGAKARADLTSDALTALNKALDALLKAVTSGAATQVVPAVTAVVTALVGYLAAVLLSGGLPAPSLPGLPTLPTLPSLPVPTPSLPVPTPSLPVPTPTLPAT
ncbi:hypothetical protein [Streptomyces sp. NPDC006739]|uniref:hypothetical protein n=1 Tax=Streptomyces sp. NPDC006739 TaxID=3364763 RepID=UPI0036760AC6